MYVKTEESQICNMQGHRDLSIMLHGAGWVFGGFADSAGHHLEVKGGRTMVVFTLCNNGTFGTILNLQSAQKRARNTTVVGRMPQLWNKYYVTVFHKIMHRHHFAS